MSDPSEPPKNISELIDRIDLIREELLRIQHSMEELETPKPAPTVEP